MQASAVAARDRLAKLRLSNNKRREPYLFDMPQRVSIYWLWRKGLI